VGLGVALSLAVLTGCTHTQRPPSNYAGVEDEFVQGCVAIAKQDNGKDNDAGQENTTKISSPTTYCQCVFDAISDPKTGVEYSEFKKIQSRMQDEGGPLPASFIAKYDACSPSEKSGS
jgi:hypothetical protein